MSQSPSRTRRIRGMDAEQRRASRREALLTTALDLFARDGYHQVSVDQICQAASISTKSFYGVFTSREDCYLALLGKVTTDVMTMLAEVIEDTPDGTEPSTDALLQAFAGPYLAEPRYATVLFGEGSAVTPAVDQQRRDNREWGSELVATIWRRADPDIEVPSGIAIGAIGGLFEIVRVWSTGERRPDTLIAQLRAFYDAVHPGAFGTPGPSAS